MKNIKNLCLAVVFMLSLTLTALAGDISTPIAPPHPVSGPSAVEGQITTGVTGVMETPRVAGDIHTPAPASASVIQAALNLVRGVLPLF